MSPTTSRFLVRVLLSAVGTAGLVGCDQRSENARSIQAAGHELRTTGVVVGADGGGAADARLRDVAAQVQAASAGGTDAEKGSASMILAQTMLAQGEAAAGKAKDLELAARNIMMRINSAAGEWAQRNAVAAAAEALDVNADLAAMAASKTEKERELVAERARQQQVMRAVEELTDAAKARLGAADEKITQYSKMTRDAAQLSATESATVFERANVIRREGEALRAEGQKIQARADEQAPLVPEIALLIDKLEKQIANYDSTAAALRRRAEAAKGEAAEARAGAEKVAREIDERVVELARLRDTELGPAFESAISQLRKAVSTANASAAASPGGGKVVAGSAQIAVAEAQWAKANGARSFATLMDALAEMTPKLPNADDYRNKGAAARTEAEESIKAATEAFESAKSAIESGGNRIQRPDVKERLTKLGQDLESKAKNVTDGIWLDIKADSIRAPSAGADSGSGGGGEPVPAELTAFLDTYLAAVRAREADKIAAVTYTSDPALKEAILALAGLQKGLFAADAASQRAFKQPIEELMGSNPMLGMMFQQLGAAKGQLAALDSLSAAELSVKMNGAEEAVVSVPGSPMPLEFVKIDGQWMQGLGAQEAGLKMAAPMMMKLTPLAAVLETWAADVSANKFADSQTAAADLSAKAMPALQGLIPGGG